MDVTFSISARSLNNGMAMPPVRHANRSNEDGVIDLKDVQNFLFVVVSSHMRVEGENRHIGQAVNTYA